MASQQAEPESARADADAPSAAPQAADARTRTAPEAEHPATEAARNIGAWLREIAAYVRQFLAAQADLVRLRIRKAILFAVLGGVALIAAVGILVTAAVLLLLGAAHGIGAGLGRPWLGELIVGIAVLGGFGLGGFIFARRTLRSWRRKLEEKYEAFRIRQRIEHGRDAAQRSGETGAE